MTQHKTSWPMQRRGFTLIELLVVITIIVVLLALLAPALNQAIYQAELTKCGAGLRGFGQPLTTYAFDHQRRYPSRPAIDDGAARLPLQMTNNVVTDTNGGPRNFDDRTVIQDYVPINMVLNCPLSKAVDLEGPESTTLIYASYSYWYGWRFAPPGTSYRGMKKYGDRFEVRDPDVVTAPVRQFRVLGADFDFWARNNNSVQQTHPDRGDMPRLANLAWNDETQPVAQAGGVGVGTVNVTRSVWAGAGRGLVDLNFVLDDGSVSRFNDLKLRDPRLVEVPATSPNNGGNANFKTYLPAN